MLGCPEPNRYIFDIITKNYDLKDTKVKAIDTQDLLAFYTNPNSARATKMSKVKSSTKVLRQHSDCKINCQDIPDAHNGKEGNVSEMQQCSRQQKVTVDTVPRVLDENISESDDYSEYFQLFFELSTHDSTTTHASTLDATHRGVSTMGDGNGQVYAGQHLTQHNITQDATPKSCDSNSSDSDSYVPSDSENEDPGFGFRKINVYQLVQNFIEKNPNGHFIIDECPLIRPRGRFQVTISIDCLNITPRNID